MTNEALKSFLKNNAGTLIIGTCSVIVFIFSFVLSIRSDLNTAILQTKANTDTISSFSNVPERLSSVEQLSKDTNEKVNFLYQQFKK